MTLDVIGHSTRDHHLLRLGDDRIDMLDPAVARFFRSLVDEHLLSRLEVVAVRLLGCETAVSPCGKRTLRLLSRTLGIPVFVAIKPLMKSHNDGLGFNPAFIPHLDCAAYWPIKPFCLRKEQQRNHFSCGPDSPNEAQAKAPPCMPKSLNAEQAAQSK